MCVAKAVWVALALGLIVLAAGQPVSARQKARAHAYVSMVADVHRDAPDDQGLLPATVAEAQIAAQYGKLAAKSSDLAAIKLNIAYALNAVDPSQMAEGPGLGFGVKRGAAESARTIEMAAKTEGASQNIVTHAAPIATICQATVGRADKIVALAKQILAATSAADASKLVAQFNTLTDQLMAGADGAPGLKQAQEHLAALKKGEGLP